MRLNSEFITHESEGQQMMVGTGGSGFSGLVRSNSTAAFIVDCLKTETTEQQIVDRMAKTYDAPRDVIARDVRSILDTLRSIGALDE